MYSSKKYKRIHRTPFRYFFYMILTILAINVLGLVLPLTMKRIYNSIIVLGAKETLLYMLLLVLGAFLFEAVLRYIKESSSRWIASQYEYRLFDHLIHKIFTTDVYDNNYMAGMETMKSLSNVSGYYSTVYYQLFIDLPFMLLYMYLIYTIGGLLVLIPIALSILYVIIVLLSSLGYVRRKKQYIETSEGLMGLLIETLDKIHHVKSNGIEDTQILKYKRTMDDVVKTEYQSNLATILPQSIGGRFSQMTLFMTLVVGGYLITQGDLTFGRLTACAMLSGRSIAPVISAMGFLRQRNDIKLLRGRIDKMALTKDRYEPTTPTFPSDIGGAIEFMDLSYKDVQTSQIASISGSIEVGGSVSIDPARFPSYSRVLKQVVGLRPVESGKVLIDSLDISQWNMSVLNGKIEYLSEEVPIFKGTVMENITFFNNGFIQHAMEAASVTGLDEMVSQMPEGYETQLDHYMLNYLSSAFLQRLNLARAFMVRPRILILDRIDESMDQETLDLFKWLIERLKGQATIIIVSWSEEIRALCHQQWDERVTVTEDQLRGAYE